MKVHATKKLLSKLPLKANGQLADGLPAAANDAPDLGEWHANLVLIQRRQSVIFVHDTTLFVVFIPCLTKPNLAQLDWHFQDVFMNTLMKSDLPPELMEKATRLLTPLQFDNTCNRSVQGTMITRAKDLEHYMSADGAKITDVLPYSTSLMLSSIPANVTRRRGVWPIKELHALIESIN